MLTRLLCAIALVTCLPTAHQALAQGQGITVSAAAVAVGPSSGSARQFTPGFGVDLGLSWQFSEQLALRIDVVQAALGAKDTPQFPASAPVRVEPRLRFGTVDLVFRAPAEKIRLYMSAGVGLYHRSVSLTVSSPEPVSVCNPWWFVCFPGPVASGQVSASRSTTNVGLNVGIGVSARRFFVEMRYHYVWGPTFLTPAGSVPATGKFLPLVLGARF
jgi:opacity protein-like surface antigen